MTVKELCESLGLDIARLPAPDKEITGVYIGDLLSHALSKAEAGNVWITIMSNVNVTAVATLKDVGCILLADGVALDTDMEEAASQKGVNVLKTNSSAYGIAKKISGILG